MAAGLGNTMGHGAQEQIIHTFRSNVLISKKVTKLEQQFQPEMKKVNNVTLMCAHK